MSRDMADANYYVSRGGIIPVKWTAPEVYIIILSFYPSILKFNNHRPSTTRNIPLPVMCGVMVVSCMRYGVLDISLLRLTRIKYTLLSLIREFDYLLPQAVQGSSTNS